jgi:hypothetical protein
MPVRAGFRWAAVLATAVLAGAPLSASCGEPSLEESLRAKAAGALVCGGSTRDG